MDKKRILFVDDEENVLRGLKVMLHRQRTDWTMSFAQSGAEAIRIIEADGPFDVVVADMHMPGMHGSDFLRHVMEKFPQTVRFVLSGNLDGATLLKASPVAHQVLAKPCDAHHLRNVLARALSLRDRLKECRLKDALLEMGSLPSVPVVYWEIMSEIESPAPSIERVGRIIEKDPGMSAKILQIVNVHSGESDRISNIIEAAEAIGLENLKNYVLVAEIFSQAEGTEEIEGFNLEQLWKHGLRVGQFAKTIAEQEVSEKRTIDDAYTAGLLHDIGLLIIASKLPSEFEKAYNYAKSKCTSLQNAEKELFGASHAAIGGYLLDLWGLPDPVVEAITYHYFPSARPIEGYASGESAGFTPITAVHIANYFCEDVDGADIDYEKAQVDTTHLEEIGMTDKISLWWDLCIRFN